MAAIEIDARNGAKGAAKEGTKAGAKGSSPKANGAKARGRRKTTAVPYLNRELAWLEFNARVLHEARDDRNPLLERVRFLTIFASNLDEFFQVRIAGLRSQVRAASTSTSPDGRSAVEQIEAATARVLELVTEHSEIYADLRKQLAAEGVEIVKYGAIPEHHAALRERFIEEIFPVLTPLAVDPGHPFPYISTLSLSIAVGLRDPETGERRFARVKIPPVLPRFMDLGEHAVRAHRPGHRGEPGPALLGHGDRGATTSSGSRATPTSRSRRTRPTIFSSRSRRNSGDGVSARLSGSRSSAPCRRRLATSCCAASGSAIEDCYEVRGMLDLTGLAQIADLELPRSQGAIHGSP